MEIGKVTGWTKVMNPVDMDVDDKRRRLKALVERGAVWHFCDGHVLDDDDDDDDNDEEESLTNNPDEK